MVVALVYIGVERSCVCRSEVVMATRGPLHQQQERLSG